MNVDNYAESDESFARRLQAQEMGQIMNVPNNADAQTPLMAPGIGAVGHNQQPVNPTVLNARFSEVSGSRATVYIIFSVNMPQVLATIIVLSMHWRDHDVCDASHSIRWKWWAIFAALRMFSYSFVVLFMDIFRPWLQERRDYGDRIKSLRNTIDAFGLIWFVVGNMWLFGDDDDSCQHPERSPIYNLCVSMLVINYIQICLPCIMAILLIPVFCFCMPCLIRILARMQDIRSTQGATEAALGTLPEIVIDSSHLTPGDDNTCPICLMEMNIGQVARQLRCKHVFHKDCVDEWLRMNASCPTCRERIFDDPGSLNANRNRINTTVGAAGNAEGQDANRDTEMIRRIASPFTLPMPQRRSESNDNEVDSLGEVDVGQSQRGQSSSYAVVPTHDTGPSTSSTGRLNNYFGNWTTSAQSRERGNINPNTRSESNNNTDGNQFNNARYP